MKTAVICVGDELLKGAVVNTNLAHIGAKLLEIGVFPAFAAEAPDTEAGIVDALEIALQRADLIITTGGLGPTADDVTREFIARRFGMRLEQDSEAAVNILRYWKSRHTADPMPPRVMNQSLVPVGAEVIQNRFGTAPGLVLTPPAEAGKTIILLPGPPGELEPMFDTEVLPRIRAMIEHPVHAKMYQVCGPGESAVEDLMLPVIGRRHPLSVAYCASARTVRLFLTSTDSDVLWAADRDVRELFRNELLSDGAVSLADEVLRLLRGEKASLATAESCTGGLIAKQLTDIPGSSDVFRGSIVSYANEVKEHLLQVSPDTLARVGAVSRETALEMIAGLAVRIPSDAAIAVTGIAGPDGGTPDKPVGLVYAAIRWRDRTEVHELHLRRSREQIRDRTAATVLDLLRRMIRGID